MVLFVEALSWNCGLWLWGHSHTCLMFCWLRHLMEKELMTSNGSNLQDATGRGQIVCQVDSGG